MTLKKQLLSKIQKINDVHVLEHLSKYVENLNKKTEHHSKESNFEAVMSMAGTIDDNEAVEMTQIINEEFNKIEGEW